MSSLVRLLPLLSLALLLAPFAHSDEKAPPRKVSVVAPIEREASRRWDFTGRLEASATAEIRSRVAGPVTAVKFTEGSRVKKGDLLFEIDARPLEAEVKVAEAELEAALARLRRAQQLRDRAAELLKRAAIGREEHDRRVADLEEAQALVQVARARLEAARLRLSFTRITAPLDGRIGRALVAPGTLVQPGGAVLATVTAHPLVVGFDVDERTFLAIRALQRIDPKGKFLARVGLTDEKDHPRAATFDRFDDRVDPKAGTVRARVALAGGDDLLPGMFARVQLEQSVRGWVVPRSALRDERGKSQVWVVGAGNRVEAREVRSAGFTKAGDVLVVGKLAKDDRVLVGEVEVKPGDVVAPENKGGAARTLEATGTLEASAVAKLTARGKAVVVTVHIKEGEAVKKGDVLCTLEVPDLVAERRRAEGDVASAKARADLGKLEVERSRRLLADKAVAPAEHERTVKAYDTALALLKAAEAVLALARAREQFASHVEAPFAGRLGPFAVRAGDRVEQGQALVTVVQAHPMVCRFPLPEREAAFLKAGLTFRVGRVDDKGFPFTGTIRRVLPTVDPGRTLTVEGEVPNPDAVLAPGTRVRVRIELPVRP